MLLPFDCLAYGILDGHLLPSWLGQADEPFVESVLDYVSTLGGLQVGEVELAAPKNLVRIARDAKMPARIAEGLWAIERKRWDALIDSPVEPEVLREVAFELGARLPRVEAIAETARRLGIAEEVVLGSLFADRRNRRMLAAPLQRSNAADLIKRYNLALAQTLLARSMEVEASVTGDADRIIAAAKRDGLLARFELDGEATRLTLTGPLSIFHDTAKYGRSIARFVPSLVATPIWSLRARVMLGTRSADFALDHTGAIAFASTLPAAPDGRLARKVARALRSVGVKVDLHPGVVRAGEALVVPDFALEWPGGRVLVDVVPFATPEYLACKLAAVEQLDVPMLVCVDERFLTGPLASTLVAYRGAIDAFSLYAAALRVALAFTSSARSSSVPPSSWRSSSLGPSSLVPPSSMHPDGAWPPPSRA